MFGRTLSAEELSRDVEGLAADDNDLLAVQELLGDSAGQATEQVSLAVNDDLYTPVLSAIAPMTGVSFACAAGVCVRASGRRISSFRFLLFLCSLRWRDVTYDRLKFRHRCWSVMGCRWV